MKIAKIEATVHDASIPIPLCETRSVSWKFVFCTVTTDDGIVGHGLTGELLPFSVVEALHRNIFQVVEGMDPRDTEAIHRSVWHRLNLRTQTGVIVNALSALDIALWDIHGQYTGRTIAQLLGGADNSAATYCTFGLPQYTQDELVAAAQHFARQGHRAFKMVVGVAKGGWREDLARIRAARDALGPDMALMLDANYAFDPLEARNLCSAAEELDIAFFEEPIMQNDARALAELRQRTRIPIAAGQMEGHRWRYRELIEHRAVDIIQPNCCYGSGYTETRKVAHAAQMFNLPMAVGGGWPTFNLQLMAGMMNGGPVEMHTVMLYVCDMLFPDAPPLREGRMIVPAAPGLGVRPDSAYLAHTRIAA